MRKRIYLKAIALLLAVMMVPNVVFADEEEAVVNYKVGIQESPNGTITTAKESYKAGDKVMIDIIPDEGFELERVSAYETKNVESETLDIFNDKKVAVADNSFVMPKSDVRIIVSFVKVYKIPEVEVTPPKLEPEVSEITAETEMLRTFSMNEASLNPNADSYTKELWNKTTPANQSVGVKAMALTDAMDGDYAFGPRIISGVTTFESAGLTALPQEFSSTTAKLMYKVIAPNTPKADITGMDANGNPKMFWQFNKVGTYLGQEVDVRISVVDYQLYTSPTKGVSNGILYGWGSSRMAFNTRGFDFIDFKYEYFRHGTSTPLTVKGSVFFRDVDHGQAVAIIDDNANQYFVTKDSFLRVLPLTIKGIASKVFVSDNNWSTPWSNDDLYHQGVIQEAAGVQFTGHTQIQRFYQARYLLGRPSGQENSWLAGNPNIDISSGTGFDHFGYSSNELSRTSLPPVSKIVGDEDEPLTATTRTDLTKNKLEDYSKEYTYRLTHIVPYEPYEQNRYQSYVMTDVLEECLEFVEGRVLDRGGTDVTDDFTIEAKGQEVTFTANNPQPITFYDNEYSFDIVVKVKE